MQMTKKEELETHQFIMQNYKSLIECGGNLNQFLLVNEHKHNQEMFLFTIESVLNRPENIIHRQKWDDAIAISNKIRMQLARCKAYELLEKYEQSEKRTGASDISYAKGILFPPKAATGDRDDDSQREGGVVREGTTKRKDNVYREYEQDFEEDTQGENQ